MKLNSFQIRLFVATLPLILIFLFQNCGNKQFSVDADLQGAALKAGEEDTFFTKEDTPFEGQLRSAGQSWGRRASFQALTQPSNGKLTRFDEASGGFSYTPGQDFHGRDSFEFAEIVEGEEKPIQRVALILVDPANDLPWINEANFQFNMNSSNNLLTLVPGDIEDPEPYTLLTQSGGVSGMDLTSGRIAQVAMNQFSYTPKFGFRGTDIVRFWVKDNGGNMNHRDISIQVGNPFRDVQPAVAVRGMGCITCHANISSDVITDFGFGSPWFFGKSTNSTVFSDGRAHASAYSDHGGYSWMTAAFNNVKIHVPKATIGVDLRTQVSDNSPARYLARTVKEYVEGVEAQKKAANPMAPVGTVLEKNSIYIGAPDAATLRARLQIGGVVSRYFPNNGQSPQLTGLLDRGSHFEMNGSATCDGDLGLDKALYIKNLRLSTVNGCRIYSTQPVVIEGAITYISLSSAKNLTNLQVMSSDTILMGIGDSHCESGSGWFAGNPTHLSPLKLRISTHTPEMRRLAAGERSSKYDNLKLLVQTMGARDASCLGGSDPRLVHFDRLMLVAPNVQSRFTGQFSGVLVAEFANFALSKFSFKFDPVFKEVPVLPLLPNTDFLEVK
jgi:hypothetical protein